MKHTITCALAALWASLALAGCSSGGGGSDGTNFNGFVENLIDDTADDTEPVAVNGQDFDFSEDEHAFDGLFQ